MPNHDDEPAAEGSRNPLVQAPAGDTTTIRAVWDRSGDNGEHGTGDFIEVPEFPVVRRGFAQDRVNEFVGQLATRVRNLERQIEEQRQGAERLRVIQEEFGNPGALLERVESLQTDLAEARLALESARAETEEARGAVSGEDERVAALEQELEATRTELADARNQLVHANNQLQTRLRQGGGPDAYGAIATQVAEVLRSAGLQAEQIRREAGDEADRQIEESKREADAFRRDAQADAEAFRREAMAEAERLESQRDEVLRTAKAEADALKREAEDYSAALRRDAQQESERLGADRDEVLREARAEAAKFGGQAEADAKRQLDQAERELLKARADADRMLNAAISRRDLVKVEMAALRERLVGAMALLDPMVDPQPQGEAEAPVLDLDEGPEAELEAAGVTAEAEDQAVR